MLIKRFMKTYFQNKLSKLLLSLAVVSAITLSCTNYNNELGNNIIPENDKLTIIVDTIDGFDIHTNSVDSFKVNTMLYGYMGSMISSRLGRVDAAYTTELFTTLTGTEVDLVNDYVIDSAILYMKLNNYIGNPDYPVTIDMYELNKNFREPTNNVYDIYAPEGYDDPYYSNFDYQNYIEDKPLMSFTITPSEVLSSTDQTFIADLPEEFVSKFQNLTSEDYDQDSIFRKIFKGVCFVPRQTYGDGAILVFDPNASSLYFQGYDKQKFEEEGEKEDGAFTIEFTHISNYELYNQAVTTLSNDVTWASATIGIDPELINDTLNSHEKSYVGGLGAAMTQLTFPIEKIHKLQDQLPVSPSAQIIVTNAVLEIPITNNSIGSLNFSLSGVVATYDFPASIYIPDIDLDGSNDDYGFGGQLDRSHKFYTLNITRYIQALLNKDTEDYVLDISGDPLSAMFEDKLTTIENYNKEGIKLRITYAVSK